MRFLKQEIEKMDNNETQMLLELRKYVITAHNSLDGGHQPLATIEQKKVAYTLSTIIKSLEDVISKSQAVEFTRE